METLRIPIDEKKSVGQIAATVPNALSVLEEQGIDYFCRGNRSLKEACEAVGLDVAEVTPLLADAAEKGEPSGWTSAPLTDLTNHLIAGHHARAKDNVPLLRQMGREVRELHQDTHPELKRIALLFEAICDELIHHIHGEEHALFPQVEALERAAIAGTPPEPPYVGGLSHRILIEYHEHDGVAEKMRKLRELTSNYQVPVDCERYRSFYAALQAFERELHEHMHLENNVLFPRAGVLESNVKLGVTAPW
jgi:regulator of cell morphogenesis and NO signaling